VLTINHTYTKGIHREYGKTDGSRRRIPLRTKVVEVLRDTGRVGVGLDPKGLLFPGIRGGFLDLHNFRARYWQPAVIAAGFAEPDEVVRGGKTLTVMKATRTPYALRHTYAAFSLAAGVNLFTLARRMGTSVKMIDDTYGHLAPDAERYERDLLDEYDAKQAESDALDRTSALERQSRDNPERRSGPERGRSRVSQADGR
jgi:integrase